LRDTPCSVLKFGYRVGSVRGNQLVGGAVGRARNRKKAHRQAGHSPQQGKRSSPADAVTDQAMEQLAVGLQALSQETAERRERETAACWAWNSNREPVPADVPQWPEGSLGGGSSLAPTW
jgi:hypothetical protein